MAQIIKFHWREYARVKPSLSSWPNETAIATRFWAFKVNILFHYFEKCRCTLRLGNRTVWNLNQQKMYGWSIKMYFSITWTHQLITLGYDRDIDSVRVSAYTISAYSPDLILSDEYLLENLNKKLTTTRFYSNGGTVIEIITYFARLNQSLFAKGINKIE